MLPGFVNTQEFEIPEGIVSLAVDPETHQQAVSECPVTEQEVFIAGTEPTDTCTLHGRNPIEMLNPVPWLKRIFR